jgi:hypothetical protein
MTKAGFNRKERKKDTKIKRKKDRKKEERKKLKNYTAS